MSILPTVNGDQIHQGVLNWGKCPYGVRLIENPDLMFKTLIEQEKFVLEGEPVDAYSQKTISEWLAILQSSVDEARTDMPNLKEADELPVYDGGGNILPYGGNYSDTRVGGNDAINPYWQFNRDDDIVPRLLRVNNVPGGDREYGLGRVYAEHYDVHQQILWLCMGIAEYSDLISFYMDAGDADAAKVMNRGSLYGISTKIIKMAIGTTIWAFTFPIMAPLWFYRWVRRLEMNRVTRYYWFLPSMTLYYEMVNTMLSYLAVNMGLYPTLFNKRIDTVKKITDKSTEGAVSSPTNDRWQNDLADAKFNSGETGIPEILKNGPDIFVIMNRRARLFNDSMAKVTTRDLLEATSKETTAKKYFNQYAANYELINKDENRSYGDLVFDDDMEDEAIAKSTKFDKDKRSWAVKTKNRDKNWWSCLKSNMFGAGLYVGFKVESTQNASESISNETGSTNIAQKLNSIAQQARDEYEDSLGGNWAARIVSNVANKGLEQGLIGYSRTFVARRVAGLISLLGKGDIGTIITNGNGFMDIPDVWKNSSFNKSYSFNIELHARYGDPVSIYQSIYIPLIMLLATGLPRSVGTSMYTSPFLVKAFCKGQFAIPCGMVTSLDITRGKENYGWSVGMLPTQVSVNISFKDMTPAMFMGMQDIGLFDTMSRNETMHEYLDTLSALGIAERLHVFPQFIRKMSTALLIKRNTTFSSTYWGGRFGRSATMRALGGVMPFYNYEKRDIEYNISQ